MRESARIPSQIHDAEYDDYLDVRGGVHFHDDDDGHLDVCGGVHFHDDCCFHAWMFQRRQPAQQSPQPAEAPRHLKNQRV